MRPLLVVCLALLGLAVTHAGTRQLPPAAVELLLEIPAADQPAAAPAPVARAASRSRLVRVQSSALEADRLTVALFPDTRIDAELVRRAVAPQGRTWEGRVPGDALGSVTLAEVSGTLQGSIRAGHASYSIEPLASTGWHIVRQVETAAPGVELPPLVAPADLLARSADSPVIMSDDGGIIDVLVAYTAAARLAAGGTDAAIAARVLLGVTEANTAFANSGVIQRLRLVGSELVGDVETGDLTLDLHRLTEPADGAMDLVHARRDATGADLVSLVIGDVGGGACGVAWMMQTLSVGFAPLAFSVTAYPCISPNYTFGHELAHNMGSAHAPEDFNFPPVFPYGYGYKDPARQFRTVMAYDCPGGCPRVLHFSNPDVSYGGTPTGTTTLSHNARSLNETRMTVANFRQQRDPSTVLGAPRSFAVTTHGTGAAFTWTPPLTGQVGTYVIEAGTAPGRSDVVESAVGATTSLVVPAVAPGTYFVRVRAYDDAGPGPPSPDIVLTMTLAGECTAPVDAPVLDAAVVAGSTVYLSWTPAAGGGAPTTHLVGAGSASGLLDVAVLDTGGAAPSFATTAEPGRYFVRVAGRNPCGVGTASNEVIVEVPLEAPGAPSGLRATIAGDGRVSLEWAAPLTGGRPASYIVEAGTILGLSDVAVLPTGSSLPRFVTTAAPGTYHVRVRAVNGAGSGSPSDDIIVTVPPRAH